jgi:hypothetical protein
VLPKPRLVANEVAVGVMHDKSATIRNWSAFVNLKTSDR